MVLSERILNRLTYSCSTLNKDMSIGLFDSSYSTLLIVMASQQIPNTCTCILISVDRLYHFNGGSMAMPLYNTPSGFVSFCFVYCHKKTLRYTNGPKYMYDIPVMRI